MFARFGRWAYDNPWTMILIWFGIIVIIFGSVGALGAAFDDAFSVPESESADGFTILEEGFGGLGAGQPGSIVFEANQGVDDTAVKEAMIGYFDDLDGQTGPGGRLESLIISSPYTGAGDRQIATTGPRAGEIAYAQITIPEAIGAIEAAEMGQYMDEQIVAHGLEEIDGLNVEIGGAILAEFEPPQTELLGLAFAVGVLIIAMGSVVAMGTTIAVAVLGVAGGFGLMALTSNITTVPEFATTIGLMIGLGVGIDYALFIVNRYREALGHGFDGKEAAAIATDTAGRSVVFAGLTVVVSLLGLLLIGLEFVSGLGIAAAATVSLVMLASVTLLPAVLRLVGDRIEVSKWRGIVVATLIACVFLCLGLSLPVYLILGLLAVAMLVLVAGSFGGPLARPLKPRQEVPLRESVWYKLSRTVQSRPWFWVFASGLVLVVMALPVFSLNLGWSDEGNYPKDTTTRQAYDLLAEGFGPGANGPLIVAAEITSVDQMQVLSTLSQEFSELPGVAVVSAPIPNDPADPSAAMIQIQPSTSPQDEATEELVDELRSVVAQTTAGTGVAAKVSGATAASIDFTAFLSDRILVFFVVVLAVSFLFLTMVFRSLMVPLKAVIMNMLSIGAAYGIVVALFQWGWASGIFGIEPAPIEPFIPMMMFAILFGLSMDYEVFILSRMKEEYERSGDATNSVADGLAATARVITAAAAIMVVVFGSFLLEESRIVKLFGFGLASAVLIDASIVRLFLVPSTMQLLGERNWWLPAWLDRVIPNLNVEGGKGTVPAERR